MGLIPFPLLVFSVVLEYTQPDSGSRFVLTAVLAGSAALWLAAMPLCHPRWRPGWRLGYFLGLLALMAALVSSSPWFTFVSWVVALHSFVLFDLRWAFFAAAGAAAGLTVAAGNEPQPPYLVAASLLAPLLAAGWFLGQENESRRRLIAELTEALSANEEMRQQLLDQARETGVRDERQRMAREIHDTLAQELSAIASQLEASLHSPNSADWRPRVTSALALARDGLAEARRSVMALTPASLAETPLPQALDALARRWGSGAEVRSGFTLDGDRYPVPEDVEAALYRVAQESLTNIAKHAKASRAHVTLSYMEERILLDVRDDGLGFDAGEPGDGHGLSGMRQRIAELSGTLTIDTGPGEGTTVSASVPARERR